MADKRAYFKVDVGYFTNPKIAAVLAESPTAVVLHLESIAYAAQHLTDGVAPRVLVMRMVGATDDDAALLLSSGLWSEGEKPGQIQIRDYLEHQRSAAQAKNASDAGRKGAQGRWQSESHADSNADRMRTPMTREKEREKERDNTPAAADAAGQRFPEFWSSYPRKVGRGQAIKAWKAATKRTDPDVILAGLHRQLRSMGSADPKFIPHPTTWLNGERWADEPAVTAPIDRRPEGWR